MGSEDKEATVAKHLASIPRQIEIVQSSVHMSHESAKSLARLINRGKGGREVALAITKLQEAMAWLHEALVEGANE